MRLCTTLVLRRVTMIGFQQSAQALDADNLAVVPFVPGPNDPVDALVNPLVMVMLHIRLLQAGICCSCTP